MIKTKPRNKEEQIEKTFPTEKMMSLAASWYKLFVEQKKEKAKQIKLNFTMMTKQTFLLLLLWEKCSLFDINLLTHGCHIFNLFFFHNAECQRKTQNENWKRKLNDILFSLSLSLAHSQTLHLCLSFAFFLFE